MRKLIPFLMLACLYFFGAQTIAQNTTPGPVWRIQYIKFKPGKSADFYKFVREWQVPVRQELKRERLSEDIRYFQKPTRDSENDWDIAYALIFKNYSEALDGPNEEIRTKRQAIVQKMRDIIYGSEEKFREAIQKFSDSQDIVRTQLVRELFMNPSATASSDTTKPSGAVWRINYIKFKPGKAADFYKWHRDFIFPLNEEYKSKGMSGGVRYFTKPTRDSENDWDIAVAFLSENYAEALDGLNAEIRTKRQAVMQKMIDKIYGSDDKFREAQRKFSESREIIMTQFVREMIITSTQPAN